MSWEDEEFEIPPVEQGSSKWEAEDKADPIRESWEDDFSERPKPQTKAPPKAVPKKGKNNINNSKKIEETLEDPLAERQRKQNQVEESDFENTTSMFAGLSSDLKVDTGNPKDARDFDALADQLGKRLTLSSTSTHYVPFLKNLFRQLTANLESSDISSIATSLSVLANEKLKSEKEKKKKKTVTKKSQVNMKNEEPEEGDYDEYTDFLWKITTTLKTPYAIEP